MRLIALILVFLSFSGTAVRAENLHALAMNGVPKYGPDFTHLDYANPDAPKGGTLHSSVTGSFDSLNNYIIRGTAAYGLSLTADTLLQRVWDEPFTLYGLVAESIDVPEDRSWIVFHLRPEARFHDGHPMTADDVLFSYEALKKNGLPVRRRIYGLVTKAEKIDEHTVRFEFGPGFDRESVLILGLMPVLPRHYWESRKFEETTLEVPLGSGPYKIAAVEPGRRITYERVKDYWAKDLPVNVGHYNFDKVIYDYYRDEDVAFESFKSGGLNFRREWDPVTWKTAYDFPALKSGEVKAEELQHSRPEWARSIIFNTRRAPFDDIRVRKALSLAFDFEWINKNIFHGAYRRNKSYFPNSELAAQGEPSVEELAVLEPYRDQLSPEVFGPAFEPPVTDATGPEGLRANLRKSMQLLGEAGWHIKDGQLVSDKTGQPFNFEITVRSVTDEKLALEFSRALKKLGITARVRYVDSAQYTGRLESFDFDATIYYWINSLSPGSEQVAYWGSAAAQTTGGRNYAGVQNPAIDALAGSLASAKTREELVAHTRALDRALMWGYYTIPLYHIGRDLAAYRKDIHHPSNIPLYGLVIETWWQQ